MYSLLLYPLILSLNSPNYPIIDPKANLLIWKRDDGSKIEVYTKSITKFRTIKGQNLEWEYTKSLKKNQSPIKWKVKGNCSSYFVDWDKDSIGALNIKNFKDFKNSKKIISECNKKTASLWYEPSKEAMYVLDKYCSD
tara:strand:+ start:579 stop:992 length:414 start_codon:yes stop_codon:yes gene_type:complete